MRVQGKTEEEGGQRTALFHFTLRGMFFVLYQFLLYIIIMIGIETNLECCIYYIIRMLYFITQGVNELLHTYGTITSSSVILFANFFYIIKIIITFNSRIINI
jgi:hypothetical protein